MNEPAVVTGEVVESTPPPTTFAPPLADVALAAYRAGVAEGGSVTMVYAPTVVLPASTPAASVARLVPDAAPAPVRPAKRHFTRPELCFYLGMATTVSGVAAVALSILAGDPSLLLGLPVAAGAMVTVGSGAAINHEERPR